MKLYQLLVLFSISIVSWQCDNYKGKKNIQRTSKITDTVFIDLTNVEFDIQYKLNGYPIKSPIPIDTIDLQLRFWSELNRFASHNEIEIRTKNKGCKVLKKSNLKFTVYFDSSFNEEIFDAVIIIKPKKSVVYLINERKYMIPGSEIELVEIRNAIIK